MQPFPQNSIEQPARYNPPASDCASPIVFALLLIWTVIASYVRASALAFLSAFPAQNPLLPTVLSGLALSLAVGLPALALAAFWKNPRYQGIFRAWAWAAGFILFLLPVQLASPSAAQTRAALHILLALLFCASIWIVTRQRDQRSDSANRSPMASAWLVSGLLALPWLVIGAFGSPLDTLLDLTAALSIGLSAGLVLSRVLLPGLLEPGSTSSWQNNLLGGFAIGGVLLLITGGTGFGYFGMQTLLMLELPSLGWAVMGLAQLNRSAERRVIPAPPLAILLGLAAAAPMTMVDPDELALIISATPGEILQWSYIAAAIAIAIALLTGVGLLIASSARRSPSPDQARTTSRLPSVLGIFALLIWLAGGVLYFTTGQPGFYGERMFVILKSHADLSGAASISDITERRRFVYRTLVDQANTSQVRLRQDLTRLGLHYTPYYLENAIEVPGNPLLRAWLLAQPEVAQVLDSPQMRPLHTQPSPMTGSQTGAPAQPQWNLAEIGAVRVWQELGVTGQGVVVGQSDSGVQGDHPELTKSYRGNASGSDDYNWLDPWNHTAHPTDEGGHGTHTLGSILGQHTGVAPGATWFGCVNLARNLGNPAVYLNCMQFMLAPYPQNGDPFKDGDPARGAEVINNSWGCPEMEGCDPNALLPAVHALRQAGVFVVASAGNDGPACDTISDPPALYSDSLSVGAVDQRGNLASFSSLGPVTADGSGRVKPDLVAPGVDVLSSMPENTYGSLSGTSMAGPHVVGVVALMWSANPALVGDIDRTEQILEQTAQPYSGPLPNCPGADQKPSTAVGYGRVDAYAAVKAALQLKK